MLQADGGTRTASITGAWVALADCIGWMKTRNMIKANVLRDNVAAISCGIYNGTPVLDLDYAEDSEADTDANFVMTGDGRIIEVQGTAEKTPFSQDEFLALMALARKGVARLVDLQKMAVDVDIARHASPEITGKLVIATHNPGKLAEMRELLAPHGVEAVSAGELGLGEPEETGNTFRANARIKAVAAAQGRAASGLRRRFRPGGRCARRRARHLLGALGRAEQGFQRRDGADRAAAAGARRDHADAAQGAFRLRAMRRLARRSSRGGRSARRRHAGVAAARHRGFRL